MAEYQAPQEVLDQFAETFSFLQHEREDVRKMAIHGIAEQSKDNRDLWAFLSSPKSGPRAVDSILQYLHAGGSTILGDILSILINCSADGTCAEMLVQRKVVRKAMRLLDGMEKSSQPDNFVRSVQEMTLMLLNNLTASHISAVDDLLQKEDEDMRGFYLGKLQQYYEYLATQEDAEDEEEEAEENAEKKEVDNNDDDDKKKKKSAAPQRDLRRWVLHILLNLTRSLDGQELLLEDEEWRTTLLSSLKSKRPIHRLLAAQCYRNCACSQSPQYPLILKSEALATAVQQLASGRERGISEIQMCLAEFIANMLECEAGMQKLESINAKRLLDQAISITKAASEEAPVVEVVEEDGVPVAPAPPAPFDKDTCEFLERHVMPYLDDIIDAYVAPGSDELD